MVLKAYRYIILPPDVEHGPVDDVGEGPLGVVGDRLTDYIRIGTSAKEPSLAAGEGD